MHIIGGLLFGFGLSGLLNHLLSLTQGIIICTIGIGMGVFQLIKTIK
jgi:hypothetical protein